jgi:hypothetical protein
MGLQTQYSFSFSDIKKYGQELVQTVGSKQENNDTEHFQNLYSGGRVAGHGLTFLSSTK